MAEFNISFQKTLTHEGAYVDDPDDLGKETYKGISRASHNDWLGWSIIDNHKNKPDFPLMLEKDKVLQKDVEVFYWTYFWLPIKAYKIQNQMNADSIYDFAVNTGIVTCVQLIQNIIGTKVDGIIGVKTLAKINVVDPKHFQAAFTVGKMAYYLSIINKRPTNKKYLYGWIIRAMEYHS